MKWNEDVNRGGDGTRVVRDPVDIERYLCSIARSGLV